MEFQSSDSSVVKSIRQRDLLNAWLRCAAKTKRLPTFDEYDPSRMSEESQDLNYYNVVTENGQLRFWLRQYGARLRDLAFGKMGNVYLEDAIGPVLAPSSVIIYTTCAQRQRPVYTTLDCCDVIGRPLSHERLILPFGADRVETIIASVKMFSPDGAFVQRDALSTVQVEPVYGIAAIIDRDYVPKIGGASSSDDDVIVTEI